MKLFYIILFFGIILNNTSFAQDEPIPSKEAIRSTLFNYSYVEFNLEYYNFNSSEHLLSQTGTGLLKVNKNAYFAMQYDISTAWLNNSSYVSLGDLSFSFTRNFYSKKYHDPGFQGIATSLKLFVPTGTVEYLSGSENWKLEPSVYFGWIFKNRKNYFTNKLRVNFSMANSDNVPKSKTLVRYEATLGYENDKFWIASTADNRLFIDNSEYYLLGKIEFGYKFNASNGLFTSFISSIIGDYFYEYYFSLGYYKTF